MPLDWNNAFTELVQLLAGLYPDPERARLVVRATGLDPGELDFSKSPKVFWLRIVEEVNRRDKIPGLLGVVKGDYPNIDIAALEQRLAHPASSSGPGDLNWKGPISALGGLEKVIGAQPTFLPISFLETGLARARAVVRVNSPLGLGTGFLTRNNLLVTNHHVVEAPEHARATKVWFNFQQTVAGGDAQVAEFQLDPDAAFATSLSDGGDDWTAVRVKGDPASQWGGLKLSDATVQVNDFVNIIQHPAGMAKQIALYHNLVTFTSDSRVQYLTDTMPGSSGSPVFDSAWRVVALHHSGGWIPEPGTNKVLFRNEGIHVRALLTGLRDRGLLPD